MKNDTKKGPGASALGQFAKDKRKFASDEKTIPAAREAKSFRTPGRPRPADGEKPLRKSFNPNFTQDNKPAWKKDDDESGTTRKGYEGRSAKKTGFGKAPARSFGKSSGGGFGKGPGSSAGKGSGDTPSFRSSAGKPASPRSAGSKDFRPAGGKVTSSRPFADKASSRPVAGKVAPSRPAKGAPKADSAVRLNKYIAASGVCSRREADEFIAAGVVTVNGEVVTEMGAKVMPGDVVRWGDQPLTGEKKVYILMNKPKGFVTTVEDPHADKTVVDIVKGLCKERVYPVGRLDKNSVGVLFLTNDGDLTKQLTHPSYNKKKIYQVTLDRALTKNDLEKISAGIELEDGPIKVDAVSWVDSGKKEVGVEIHSGRNRIVRRIFEHFGYKVVKLDRVYFAGLTKEGLRRGQWKFLSPQEVSRLKAGLYE